MPSAGKGSKHASSTHGSVWLLPLPCTPTAASTNGSCALRYTGCGGGAGAAASSGADTAEPSSDDSRNAVTPAEPIATAQRV